MMNLQELEHIYFLGIGGIGMSALARYFHARGIQVSGYDRTPTSLTEQLQKEGMSIHFEDDPALISADIDLVVYTPAIPSDLKELNYLKSQAVDILKRSEVLGLLTTGSYTIAVAGTHGKTTVCSMIAHILKSSGKNMSALVGGLMTNYNSNFIGAKDSDIFVVEADEYDKSFLRLEPDIAVITSMDADHLDIYDDHNKLQNTFCEFSKRIKRNGCLIFREGLQMETGESVMTHSYATTTTADYFATNIRASGHKFCFTLHAKYPETCNISLDLPGEHNIENALAASAVAIELGIPLHEIKQALESFKGVKRRFEYIIKTRELVFIDDYAHHPAELKACIGAVKKLYPGMKITGIFQPHLYSRTRDFSGEFAESLEALDEIILLDIYPAREQPIEGISSKIIYDQIRNKNKKLIKKEELPQLIKEMHPGVILTLGAGDIDKLIEPIKNLLTEYDQDA